MRIPVDKESAVPLYRQIGSYLRQSILSGTLPAGTRLPAARRLAADLGVSRITVETAYADLEADGLIARRMGSGSFVLRPGPLLEPRELGTGEWPAWQRKAAGDPGARGPDDHEAPYALFDPYDSNDLAAPHDLGRDEVDRDGDSERISFTGYGDPRLFRIEEFSGAIRQVIRRDGADSLDVGDPRGYAPLRESVAYILTSQAVDVHPDHVLITSGSQQGLTLVVQFLLKAGGTVITENPTYDGALRLFEAHGAKVVGCPTDGWGMQVDALEELIKEHRPRLIYTIPNFQNPTGASLSIPRRRALVALADRYDVPILEDDFVGDLRYEGQTQPALKAFDPGGRVIYAGTFSKLLMPGLRVGFLVVEGPVYRRLVELKRVNDLWTTPLIQRALEAYVTVGRYHAHLRRLCRVYRKRRDRMLHGVERFLSGCNVEVVPQGGLFLWVRLPGKLSAAELLPLALDEGVEFTPGARFFPGAGEGTSNFRLNFAVTTVDEIDEGVLRLNRALERLMDSSTPAR